MYVMSTLKLYRFNLKTKKFSLSMMIRVSSTKLISKIESKTKTVV